MKIFVQTVGGIALFVILAVGLLAGVRNFDRQPSVILTSTECAPPCWYGIQPGETSLWRTYEILDHFKGINNDSLMWETGKDGALTSIDWFFQQPVSDSGGYIYFKNDKVTAIEILTVNSGLRLSDLFKKVGEPDEYWTTVGRGENRQYLEVTLIQRTKGYAARVLIDFEGIADEVEIQEKTPLFTVVYFAPEMFDELLKTKTLINHPMDSNTFQTWKGFGTIPIEKN